MKIQAAGITAEYNPFHNGHLWQLQALRRILGDVPVIVCMSGWFVQRGEPALADPWIRAEAAVRSGADLVLLLPSLYSLRSADFFAEGAVKLLAATGLIGTLVCSTEGGMSSGAAKNPHESPVSDSVQTCKEESLPTGKTLSAARTSLAETAAWALQESTVQQVRTLLKNGISYGAAWEAAARAAGKDAGWFSGSNNLLAVAYQKSILKNRLTTEILPLPRQGSGYKEEEPVPPYASASSIRIALQKGIPLKTLSSVMPEEALSVFAKAGKNEFCPGLFARQADILTSLLSYNLLHHDSTYLFDHSSANRDLCDRFSKERGKLQQGYDFFCSSVANRRDPLPAVQRLCLQLLLQKPRSFWTAPPEPSYIRVLAFNNRGRNLLKEMKHTATLPLITKAGNESQYLHTEMYRLLQADADAADLFQLLRGNRGRYGTCYTNSPVYVKQ